MNGYERFMTALRREQPDRVPLWELIVNDPTLSSQGATSLEEFVELEDLDAITVFEDMPLRPANPSETASGAEEHHHVVDDWGITWGTTEHGIPYPVTGPIRSAEDLKNYRPPDPDEDHRLKTLRSAVQRFKGRKAIVFLTHDGFEFPHYLRGGMDRLLIDFVESPELVHSLAEITLDFKIRLMRRAIAIGADAVVSGDDYASRSGPLMSPRYFREYVLPYLKRSVEAAHDAGALYIKHTDGDIWRLLDLFVEAGVDAVDPLEPIAKMDIGQVKQRYGDRLALVGNIDCTQLLPYGTEDEIVEAVKETIAKAAPGGGYIMASSNSLHPGVKPENYRTMAAAARRWGQYPLDPRFVEEYSRKDYVGRLLQTR